MELQILRPDEGDLLKQIALRMYADAPTAYNETVAQAKQRPAVEWAQWAQLLAAGGSGIGFVATADGEPCGFVLGILLDANGKPSPANSIAIATLGRLWVMPNMRGRGIGQSLVEAVVNWARQKGMKQIELAVGEENYSAVRLYERVGFRKIRKGETTPELPGITFCLMCLEFC